MYACTCEYVYLNIFVYMSPQTKLMYTWKSIEALASFQESMHHNLSKQNRSGQCRGVAW